MHRRNGEEPTLAGFSGDFDGCRFEIWSLLRDGQHLLESHVSGRNLNDPFRLFRYRSILNCVDVCLQGLGPAGTISKMHRFEVR